MIGAGVFAAVGPAAEAAGSGLLIGLAVAAVVAYCNATSSAALAAVYPESGGTYVYGRERLGPLWGHLAGWGFVVGKTASCAAMALTFGAYTAPALRRPLAVAAVAGLTAVNYLGIRKTAWLTRAIVAVVLASLGAVVWAALGGGTASVDRLGPLDAGPAAVLQAAGLLFFAFAGYARIATLGEEVRDPARTIPRAIPLALVITLVVYAAVTASALLAAGPSVLARAAAPLEAAVRVGRLDSFAAAVRIGGAVASLGCSCRCSWGSAGPRSPWAPTGASRGGSERSTRGAASRTMPSWPPARSSRRSSSSPTCVAPSASARSPSSSTTPLPTRPPGPSHPTRGAPLGLSRQWASWGAWCWRSRCRCRASPLERPCSLLARSAASAGPGLPIRHRC
jgi:hypothetical protein